MTVVAILQARASSTRLPGKVLKPILGEPMLARQIERVRRARGISELVIATSDRADDDAVAAIAERAGVGCFRGALDDVLDRVHRAARTRGADHVVRLTGDCPLADPRLIDDVIALHLAGDHDYTSNTMPPTWPDGLDVEVVRATSLAEAWRAAELPSDREHVTPFIRNRPRRFGHANHVAATDRSHLRWTVDGPADLAFVRTVYERLYATRPDFTTADVVALLQAAPALADINAGIGRNEGLARSLAQDRDVLRRRVAAHD